MTLGNWCPGCLSRHMGIGFSSDAAQAILPSDESQASSSDTDDWPAVQLNI